MIKQISLENFAAFKSLDLEFSSGINIIIGENSCGKTQLLKALYAAHSEQEPEKKLLGLFKPHTGKLTGLYHKGGDGKAKVKVTNANDETSLIEFGSRTVKPILTPFANGEKTPVLIPTKEVLSLLPAIQSGSVTDETLSILFDDTVIDLCKLLLSEPTSDTSEEVNHDPRCSNVMQRLVLAIGGKYQVTENKHSFINGKYIELSVSRSQSQTAQIYSDMSRLLFNKKANTETSVTMTAEGYRKIGLLQRLIETGNLLSNKTSCLLWDEPESNINPALMKLVVECLFELARNGQQIIIASHNYVMLKWFDLLMDASKGDHVSYHALFKNDNGEITKETTNNYKMLSENAIANTYSDLYDAELKRSLGVNND